MADKLYIKSRSFKFKIVFFGIIAILYNVLMLNGPFRKYLTLESGFSIDYSQLKFYIPAIIGLLSFYFLFIKKGIKIQNRRIFLIYDISGITLFQKEIKPFKNNSLALLQFTLKGGVKFDIFSNSLKLRKDYSLYYLNESHSRRRLIISTENKMDAELILMKISKILEYPIVKYNPPSVKRRRRK